MRYSHGHRRVYSLAIFLSQLPFPKILFGTEFPDSLLRFDTSFRTTVLFDSLPPNNFWKPLLLSSGKYTPQVFKLPSPSPPFSFPTQGNYGRIQSFHTGSWFLKMLVPLFPSEPLKGTAYSFLQSPTFPSFTITGPLVTPSLNLLPFPPLHLILVRAP